MTTEVAGKGGLITSRQKKMLNMASCENLLARRRSQNLQNFVDFLSESHLLMGIMGARASEIGILEGNVLQHLDDKENWGTRANLFKVLCNVKKCKQARVIS